MPIYKSDNECVTQEGYVLFSPDDDMYVKSVLEAFPRPHNRLVLVPFVQASIYPSPQFHEHDRLLRYAIDEHRLTGLVAIRVVKTTSTVISEGPLAE